MKIFASSEDLYMELLNERMDFTVTSHKGSDVLANLVSSEYIKDSMYQGQKRPTGRISVKHL